MGYNTSYANEYLLAAKALLRGVAVRKQAEEKTRRRGELSNGILPSPAHSLHVLDASDYAIGMADAAGRARKAG